MRTLKFVEDEVWPLLNVLNEINHGLWIYKFEEKISALKSDVLDLYDKIDEKYKNQDLTMEFNEFEIKIIKNSFSEVFRQIDDWEFQTRLGITRDEAKQILEKITSATPIDD